MPILNLPDARFVSVEWRLTTPQQVNRSGYTGRRQVLTNPWHSRWSAAAEHLPIIGERNVLTWRAFMAKLKGQEGLFRMPAGERTQLAIPANPKAGGLPAPSSRPTALVLTGLPPSATTVLAGYFMTVWTEAGAQMVQLTDSVPANGAGVGVAQFEPALRSAPLINSDVEVRDPWCVMALDDSVTGWTVSRGQQYVFSLQASEVF